MSQDLLRLLACPACRTGELAGLASAPADGKVTCTGCGEVYGVHDGLPILLPPGTDPQRSHDELDHLHDHKRRQREHFDHAVAEEFETVRPHGTPRAYRWLLGQKLARAVADLPDLRGASVVDACCGSGMEAEYLARKGARVVAVDISEGAALRARARARRFGLDYLVVVGDVERLPVRTRAADLAFVHDGLHHLSDPLSGVRELARAADLAVSIPSPPTPRSPRWRSGSAWRPTGRRRATRSAGCAPSRSGASWSWRGSPPGPSATSCTTRTSRER